MIIHHHSWLTSTQNEHMSTSSRRIRMNDKRKHHIDRKRSPQVNCSKQLQTHNQSTIGVENINSTDKGRDFSLTSHGFFPRGQKGCNKRSKVTGELLYIDEHILSESKTRRKNLGKAKRAWYGPANLNNKLSQNV